MQEQTNNSSMSRDLYAMPGLESLIDRLLPGMDIKARIIEVVGNNMFILRVWGYNILTESNYPFEKFNEVILHVHSIAPKLVFNLRLAAPVNDGGLYA